MASRESGMGASPLRVLVGMPFGTALAGSERILRALAGVAEEGGLRLHVVFFAAGPLEAELRAAGVATSVVPLGRFRHLRRGARVVGELRRLISDERPDVVLGWLPRAHVYLAPATWLAGTGAKVAWWQHDTPRGELLERLATLIPAAGIICESHAAAEAQLRLRPRRRCLVCHPGIEPPRAGPAAELSRLRGRLGIPPDRVVIGLPGRFVRWKGQDRFVRALAELVQEGRDVHGLLVGDTAYGIEPEYEPEVRALVARLALEDRCTFTGHVDDVTPYIQLMDVLVNASDGEPFGLTLVEAMSLGVPVLAVDRAGPREIAGDDGAALLVPDGEPATLAAGLGRLAADEGLRARLAAAGRERYEDAFTAEALARRASACLRAVADGTSPQALEAAGAAATARL